LYEFPLYIGHIKKGGKRNEESVEKAELFQCFKEKVKQQSEPKHAHHPHRKRHSEEHTQELSSGDVQSSQETVQKSTDMTIQSKGIIKRIKERVGEIPFLNQTSYLSLVETDTPHCFRAFTISTMPLFQKCFHYLEDIWKLEDRMDKIEFNRVLLTDIDHRLHDLKDYIVAQHDNLTKISQDPIEDLQYEYRGLMLIVAHFLYECRDDLSHMKHLKHHVWFFHNPKQNIESLESRGKAILGLLEMAVSLEERRMKKKQSSPFLDDFDIEEFEHYKKLDISGVLLEMGRHYAPRLGQFFSLMVRVTASKNVSDSFSEYNKFVRTAVFASANVFYSFFKEEAAKGCLDFFKRADVLRAQRLWNLAEGKLLQKLLFSSLPPMKVFDSFSIESSIQKKRETLKVLLDVPSADSPQKSSEQAKEVHKESAGKSESELKKIVAEKTSDGQISMKDFKTFSNRLYRLLPEEYAHDRIRLNLISDVKFNGWGGLEMKPSHPWIHFFKQLAEGDRTLAKEKLFSDSPVPCVILFIHGGGFISLNSSSHSMYLFDWAKELKIPIIAVDYENAPQETFPTQIEECLAVYNHIVENSERMFGAKVRVILAGDSAGGNMCMATVLKCIETGTQIPDGVVTVYPATYVAESPSPARLLALIDPLVNLSFLKLCGTAYPHPESCSKTNPFLSPIVAPDEILAQFPPCFLSVGSLDPLFDDAVWMAKRLNKLTGKVCLNLLDSVGHGFCNMLTVVPEARQANSQVTGWMKELLQEFKRQDEVKARCSESVQPDLSQQKHIAHK